MKNKLLWIDHSYHKKTASSKFYSDYLKIFFDIDIIYDESWDKNSKQELELPDLKNYSTIVLWQSLPNKNILKKLKNKNVTFVPMYDGVQNWDYFNWVKVKDFKILCFSKAIFDLLNHYNFETFYFQYYTEPQDFSSGEPHSVFFWQRVNKINFETVKNLLGNYMKKCHLHKSIDPTHKETTLSQNEIKKYNITTSNWFETREDFNKVIKDSEIFIAPRFTEGIGLPILEAMSMGKVVIANNAPTMNEYIIDGVNGYLRDFRNPKNIDFSDIENIKQNAYNSAIEGHKKWLMEREKSVEFIKKTKQQGQVKLFKFFITSICNNIFSYKNKNGSKFLSIFFIKIKF